MKNQIILIKKMINDYIDVMKQKGYNKEQIKEQIIQLVKEV